MAVPSACSNDKVISVHVVRNSFRAWGGNADKSSAFTFSENESFGFTSEFCLFFNHHSKGQMKVTCWLMLAFLTFLV